MFANAADVYIEIDEEDRRNKLRRKIILLSTNTFHNIDHTFTEIVCSNGTIKINIAVNVQL